MLVSGSGTLLQALIDAAADPDYGGADRGGGGRPPVPRASSGPSGPAYRRSCVGRATSRPRRLGRRAGRARLGGAPRFVVTAGFMRILGPATLGAQPVVNTHPALLPSFPGAHGVRDALAYGVKVTGTTCHVVDAGVDTGPIIEQRVVAVEDDDTEESLHERIKVQERDLLVEMVGRLAREGFAVEGRRVRIGAA